MIIDLWGNPADSTVLGMIVPNNLGVLADSGWAFIISFKEMGYVKDDDAEDIDYDDLLKDMQKESEGYNPERIKEGYEPITLVGWASKPFYDKELKTLHWAKELKFGEATVNTLNYNLRILGRKGVYNLNAVATMNELPAVKKHIAEIVRCVEFKDGNKYADFIPDVDEVAAFTIGGLVAGKVLAKAGFFVLIAKFWKVIALAFAAVGGTMFKFFKRKKDNTDSPESTS